MNAVDGVGDAESAATRLPLPLLQHLCCGGGGMGVGGVLDVFYRLAGFIEPIQWMDGIRHTTHHVLPLQQILVQKKTEQSTATGYVPARCCSTRKTSNKDPWYSSLSVNK